MKFKAAECNSQKQQNKQGDVERKQVREDRGTQEEYAKKEAEASKKVTEAKEKEAAAATGTTQSTPSTPGLDYSGPDAMFRSAMARKNASRNAAAGAGPSSMSVLFDRVVTTEL